MHHKRTRTTSSYKLVTSILQADHKAVAILLQAWVAYARQTFNKPVANCLCTIKFLIFMNILYL